MILQVRTWNIKYCPSNKNFSFASEAAQQTSSKSNANIAEKLIRLPPHK